MDAEGQTDVLNNNNQKKYGSLFMHAYAFILEKERFGYTHVFFFFTS